MTEARLHALAGIVVRVITYGYGLFWKSGWIRSRWGMKAVTANGEAIPWLTYPAIEYVSRTVQKDWRVCEYGCGQSTVWYSKHCGEVCSVDDNPEWAAYAASRAPSAKVSVETEVGRYATFATKGFDLIIIDGRWRPECARHVIKLQAPMVILDNADNQLEARSILAGAYKHVIPFCGLTPAFRPEETCVFLEPTGG